MAFIKKIFWWVFGCVFEALCRLFEEDDEDEGWYLIKPKPAGPAYPGSL